MFQFKFELKELFFQVEVRVHSPGFGIEWNGFSL